MLSQPVTTDFPRERENAICQYYSYFYDYGVFGFVWGYSTVPNTDCLIVKRQKVRIRCVNKDT